jgi:hypothetical protein
MTPHPELSTALRVGVTGHRNLGLDPTAAWTVHAQCVRILDRLRGVAELGKAGVVAYTALAVGADQLFGRAAVGLGIPLVGVVPFESYAADFVGPEREDYEALLLRCHLVHRLPHKRRSNKAYMDAGRWLVDQTTHLVAVWDGLPAAGLGGTGDVVAYAERKGRTVLRIDAQPVRSLP